MHHQLVVAGCFLTFVASSGVAAVRWLIREDARARRAAEHEREG